MMNVGVSGDERVGTDMGKGRGDSYVFKSPLYIVYYSRIVK
jgi:hypothetical protein